MLALPRVVHLGHVPAAAQDLARPRQARGRARSAGAATARSYSPRARIQGRRSSGSPRCEIDLGRGIGVRPRRVVDAKRRIDLRLAARSARGRSAISRNGTRIPPRTVDVDLARTGQRRAVWRRRARKRLAASAHRDLPTAALPASGSIAGSRGRRRTGLLVFVRRSPKGRRRTSANPAVRRSPGRRRSGLPRVDDSSLEPVRRRRGHQLSGRWVRMGGIHGGTTNACLSATPRRRPLRRRARS